MDEHAFVPTLDMLRARGARQTRWHDAAAAAAENAAPCGRRTVFIRGVVEISNICRENCAYCGMRRDQRNLARRRARVEDLADLLVHHRPASMTDVNLQAGEDPVAVRDVALPLIRLLHRDTPLGISVCLGTLDPALYVQLREAGATVYIMKFEVGNPLAYARFEAPGNLPERLSHIRTLHDTGWRVSSGFIAGLPGRGEEGALEDLALAARLPLFGCSVSPFVPGETTPLAHEPPATLDLTLNCMAALRLARPRWVIPAVSALNLADPIEGYRRGLRVGANLATINLTPPGLRDDYVIYRRDRVIMTEEAILRAIDAEHLAASRVSLCRPSPEPAAPASLHSAAPRRGLADHGDQAG